MAQTSSLCYAAGFQIPALIKMCSTKEVYINSSRRVCYKCQLFKDIKKGTLPPTLKVNFNNISLNSSCLVPV